MFWTSSVPCTWFSHSYLDTFAPAAYPTRKAPFSLSLSLSLSYTHTHEWDNACKAISPEVSIIRALSRVHSKCTWVGCSNTAQTFLSCWGFAPHLLYHSQPFCPHLLYHSQPCRHIIHSVLKQTHGPWLLSWRWHWVYGVTWWVFLWIFSRYHFRVEKKLTCWAQSCACLVVGWGGGQMKWQAGQHQIPCV